MAAPKKKPQFCCQNCGATFAKWMGRCTECDQLNTVVEIAAPAAAGSAFSRRDQLASEPVAIKTIAHSEESELRMATEINYLDRILNQGVPPGTALLLAGEPGIGKSTLLFQMMLAQKEKVLYVTAEESVRQIAKRFKGFQKNIPDSLFVVSESRVSSILAHIEVLQPTVVVIDSIQMMVLDDELKSRGGAASLREAADLLVQNAKQRGHILWIVGHVNKEGDIAGPKTLEHLVDTVLVFSMAEDSKLRILQSQKHRFGPSGEVVLLEMSDQGLHEKKDSDDYWIHARNRAVSGCALVPVVMGSRVICVEVQALVIDSYFPSPRRSTSGFDLNRLLLLLAVLEKRMKVPFSRSDVYLNIVGGLKIADPAADLAVAAALLSAYTEKAIAADTVFCAEIGLTGELRAPTQIEERLKSVSRLPHLKNFVGPEMKLARRPETETHLKNRFYATADEALQFILVQD